MTRAPSEPPAARRRRSAEADHYDWREPAAARIRPDEGLPLPPEIKLALIVCLLPVLTALYLVWCSGP